MVERVKWTIYKLENNVVRHDRSELKPRVSLISCYTLISTVILIIKVFASFYTFFCCCFISVSEEQGGLTAWLEAQATNWHGSADQQIPSSQLASHSETFCLHKTIHCMSLHSWQVKKKKSVKLKCIVNRRLVNLGTINYIVISITTQAPAFVLVMFFDIIFFFFLFGHGEELTVGWGLLGYKCGYWNKRLML